MYPARGMDQNDGMMEKRMIFFLFECIVGEEPHQLSPVYRVGQKVHYLMEKPELFGQPNN